MANLPLFAGMVSYRRARTTGTHVGVYRAAEAGIEDDPTIPWATVCEEHAGVICHETRKLATEWAPHPEEWCRKCQENQTRRD